MFLFTCKKTLPKHALSCTFSCAPSVVSISRARLTFSVSLARETTPMAQQQIYPPLHHNGFLHAWIDQLYPRSAPSAQVLVFQGGPARTLVRIHTGNTHTYNNKQFRPLQFDSLFLVVPPALRIPAYDLIIAYYYPVNSPHLPHATRYGVSAVFFSATVAAEPLYCHGGSSRVAQT